MSQKLKLKDEKNCKNKCPVFSHFLIFTPLFMGMGHTCHRAGGQRTTRGSWFSPNIMWVLGNELGSSGLGARAFLAEPSWRPSHYEQAISNMGHRKYEDYKSHLQQGLANNPPG